MADLLFARILFVSYIPHRLLFLTVYKIQIFQALNFFTALLLQIIRVEQIINLNTVIEKKKQQKSPHTNYTFGKLMLLILPLSHSETEECNS